MTSIHILYSDPSLLVINKPAGLLNLPDGYDPSLPHVRSVLEAEYGRLWIVHRLDKDTSGVLVLARSAAAHRALNLQFECHAVEKIYHALVSGDPAWEQREVDLPLLPDGDRQHRTVVDRRWGKEAHTGLRVLERFGECALVEAIPQTGRTHQVRAHLASLGHPLVADALYGGGQAALLNRLGLHAFSLDFTHPQSGEKVCLEAPYPEDFQTALQLMRQRTGSS
jgi:tRNA pseudouridine32 synthase / 23S rRNA pseudouridine746 synthase